MKTSLLSAQCGATICVEERWKWVGHFHMLDSSSLISVGSCRLEFKLTHLEQLYSTEREKVLFYYLRYFQSCLYLRNS